MPQMSTDGTQIEIEVGFLLDFDKTKASPAQVLDKATGTDSMQSPDGEQCWCRLCDKPRSGGQPLSVSLCDEAVKDDGELGKLFAMDGSQGSQITTRPSADDILQLCKERARKGASENLLKKTQSAHRFFTG